MNESNGAGQREHEIARRRWRNLLITAQAADGKVSSEARKRLERRRRELGLSIAETSAIAQECEKTAGVIEVSGTPAERLAFFRDILTMCLVDDTIHEREKALILRLARHLQIDEDELDRHIEECRAALEAEDNRSAVSSRIFRRIDAEDGDEYAQADAEDRRRLQTELLKRLTSLPAPPGADGDLAERYGRVVAEDREVAKRLFRDDRLDEGLADSYLRHQQRLFVEEQRVASMITMMVLDGHLDPAEVQEARRMIRHVLPVPGSNPVIVEDPGGNLTLRRYIDSLDHTFYVSVLQIAGQVDARSAPTLSKELDAIREIKHSAGRLAVLDLSEVQYLSSAAIGAILEHRARILESWGDLHFVSLSPEAADVMELLGVGSIIVTCKTLDEALWSFTRFADVVNG
jgi:anti-anti-sigma factor